MKIPNYITLDIFNLFLCGQAKNVLKNRVLMRSTNGGTKCEANFKSNLEIAGFVSSKLVRSKLGLLLSL